MTDTGARGADARGSAETIVEALYTNFLLRDIFAKIVPGGLVLLALGTALPRLGLGFDRLADDLSFGWVVLAGAAWILGFAVQTLAETTFGFMRHRPAGWLDDAGERYRFRSHFIEEADPAHLRRRERYAIIKEACGNGSFALVLSGAILVAGRVIHGTAGGGSGGETLLALAAFVVAVTALWRTNRSHARKEYRFMNLINARTGGPTVDLSDDG